MNIDIIKTSNQLKEKLIELKWKNGFECVKCKHTDYTKVNKTDKLSSRKCRSCSYIASPVANTLFGNIKIDLEKALGIYKRIKNNPDVRDLDLEEEFKVRRQTIARFKKKIIANDFKILYGDFEIESPDNSCIQLIIKLKSEASLIVRFQMFISNNYFNDDENISKLFSAIVNSNFPKVEGKIEISDNQKWELYRKITNNESLGFKDFMDNNLQDLASKFIALESLIEDFLIIEEIKNKRKKGKKEKITSLDAKIKKMRYLVFLEGGYFNLLEKAFNEDTIQLQQQENKKYTSYHYFDLKYYMELTKIKMLKEQNKIITDTVNFKNLALNHSLATQIRFNRIALEYCRNSFDRVNNEGYHYLNHIVAIQKKQEKYFGKVKLKNEVGQLTQFVNIINNIIDSSLINKKGLEQDSNVTKNSGFDHFKMLFPILKGNYERLSKAHRKEAIKIVVDYCKMFLIKSAINYEQLYNLLKEIIKDDKILGIDETVTHDNLKYFVLICCKFEKYNEARELLSNNIKNIDQNLINDVLTFNNEVIRFYEDDSHTYKKYIVNSPFSPKSLGLDYEIGWFMLRVKGRYFTDKEFDQASIDYFEEFRVFIEDKKEDEIKLPDRLACLNFIELFIQLYCVKFKKNQDYLLEYDKKISRTIRLNANPKIPDIKNLKIVLGEQEYNIDKFWLDDEIDKL